MKLPSLQQAYLEASRAARRFPFVLLCALTGVIAALFTVESAASSTSSVAYPIIQVAALGLPLLAALAMSAEKRKWNSTLSVIIQLFGILLLVGYAFTIPTTLPHEPAVHVIRFALLAAGLVLFLMIAPYLKKGEANGFWQYNKVLFFRLFVTAVFASVLFAGLAIALAALNNLFGVPVPGKRYFELWIVIAGLFSPWFFLSGMPEDLDGLDRAEEYPKGLKIFAQYILLSLVIVYWVILYAYLLKILLHWNWPKGWVSSLILGFSATAILALLLMHPIRDRSGNAWIRAADKWLYLVLIPLIVVLFLAVTERIGDYGITESRYAGYALGIWLTAQVLYFLFSRSKSIKFTVGSLCLLSFLMSFGPWGLLSVSQRSQVNRLRKLLAKNEILVDGKVHKEHGKVSQEDEQEINSIVSYLSRIHGYDAIQPWFADELRQDIKPGQYSRNLPASDVLGKIGVAYMGYPGSQAGRTFSVDSKKSADISAYDRLLVQQSLWENRNVEARRFDGEGISYVMSSGLDKMAITIGDAPGGSNTLQVNIGAFADTLLRDYANAESSITNNMNPDAMAISAEQNGQKVRLFIRRLKLIRRDSRMMISDFTADIAYTVKK
jgi:Domain of unknown function (DUF4153)